MEGILNKRVPQNLVLFKKKKNINNSLVYYDEKKNKSFLKKNKVIESTLKRGKQKAEIAMSRLKKKGKSFQREKVIFFLHFFPTIKKRENPRISNGLGHKNNPQQKTEE